MVIVAIASPKANTKVPEIEQILSAGAAVQHLINAAHALGFGAMWRTGECDYDPAAKAGLGLHAEERIVGFVYLGTEADVRKASPPPEPAKFFTTWTELHGHLRRLDLGQSHAASDLVHFVCIGNPA